MQTQKETLGFKIHFSFGLLAAFLLILSGFTVYSISSLNGMASLEVRKIDLAGRTNTGFSQMSASARGVLLGTMTSNTRWSVPPKPLCRKAAIRSPPHFVQWRHFCIPKKEDGS